MSELLSRTLGEKVKVETVLAGGLWRAKADFTQLESAILNLAINGRDAMAAGGDEAKRAFEAMMTMKKINVAAIEKARRG